MKVTHTYINIDDEFHRLMFSDIFRIKDPMNIQQFEINNLKRVFLIKVRNEDSILSEHLEDITEYISRKGNIFIDIMLKEIIPNAYFD